MGIIPLGPKVKENLESSQPFKVKVFGPNEDLALVWPDNSAIILHLDDADVQEVEKYLNLRELNKYLNER